MLVLMVVRYFILSGMLMLAIYILMCLYHCSGRDYRGSSRLVSLLHRKIVITNYLTHILDISIDLMYIYIGLWWSNIDTNSLRPMNITVFSSHNFAKDTIEMICAILLFPTTRLILGKSLTSLIKLVLWM